MHFILSKRNNDAYTSVLLLPSTVNLALIRRTFADDVLSAMPGPPHYHIMQNSVLLSSSDLIISLFSSY